MTYQKRKMAGFIPMPARKALVLSMIAFGLSACKKDLAPETADELSSGKGKSGTSVADFTIAVIPDTQYQVSSQNGGLPAMFTSQIDWIKANQVAENIVYVASLGDITDHGNTYASEWTNASTNGYYKLESQAGFTNGIPYGTCVGNHDQTPNTGHPLTCSTSSYNSYFGANRFRPRAYYGESYYGSSSNNNDSHYDLFTAGGVDFIVFYVEYDSHGDDAAVNTWVYNTLGTYSTRKAIIISHMTIDAAGDWGTTGSTYAQGFELWDRIKTRQNVFMTHGGHFTGESYRQDLYNGNTIRSYMADYQGWANGGAGYMRLLKFSVDNNTVSVRTYSPYANVWQTDANSQFTKRLFGTGPDDFEHNDAGVAPHGYSIPNGGFWVSNGVTPFPTGYLSSQALYMSDGDNLNKVITKTDYLASTSKTFEFKIRTKAFAASGGAAQFILKSGTTTVFHMAVFPSGAIGYYNGSWNTLPGTPVPLDTWKSIKVVANASSTAAIYVDGVLIGNAAKETASATSINGYGFGSGGSAPTGDQCLFDDVILY